MNLIGFGLVLLAVTGGALYAEGPAQGAGKSVWNVEFLADSGPGPEGSGNAQDGETTTARLSFERANITAAEFHFSFVDTYRFAAFSPAGVAFRVTSPGGTTSEQAIQPGAPTTTTITFLQLCTVPGETTVSADTQAEAASKALALHPANENGTGEWTVEITVTRDTLLPLPGAGGIAWTARTRLDGYFMEVSERLEG